MSANDICAIEELDRLIEAGVTAFKIEGVLKDEDYITEVVTIYRDALIFIMKIKKHTKMKNKISITI